MHEAHDNYAKLCDDLQEFQTKISNLMTADGQKVMERIFAIESDQFKAF